MNRSLGLIRTLAAGLGLLVLGACASSEAWISDFPVDKSELAPTGRNPYFILEPGYTLVLQGGNVELTITVLDETKLVDEVETRVVEERETKSGRLAEVSRNYFAIDRRTNDVYYFGEDVDIYRNEQVVSHEGAWLSGVDGAKFGLMMPGEVTLNARFYNEVAPEVALDRVTVLSVSETVETPAGTFINCVRILETTPLQPGIIDYKYYAAGVGIVQDGSLKLVRIGAAGEAQG